MPNHDELSALSTSPVEMRELDRRLRSLARTLVGDETLADDVVQDAWVAVLGRRTGAVQAVRAWMVGVVRHRSASTRQRGARRRELEQLGAATDAVVPPSKAVENQDSVDVLGSAIDSLNEPYRGTLRMRFFEMMEISEIAAATQRPESTVRSQLSRGIAELRRQLDERHGGDRSHWSLALLPFARATEPGAPAAKAASGFAWLRMAFVALALVTVVGGAALAVRLVRTERATPEADLARIEAPAAPTGTDAEGVSEEPVEERPRVAANSAAEATAVPPVEVATVPAQPQPVAVVRVELVDPSGALIASPRVAIKRGQGFFRGILFDVNPFEIKVYEPDVFRTEGRSLLTFSASGDGEAWSSSILVTLEELAGPITVSTRGPGSTVELEVLDTDGQPIGEAHARLSPTGSQGVTFVQAGVNMADLGWEYRTPAEGVVHFEHEPRATRDLEVSAVGYPPTRRSIDIDEDVERVRVELSRGGILRGTCRLPDGSPAAGARVRVIAVISDRVKRQSAEAVVLDDGTYELLGLGDPDGAGQRVFATYESGTGGLHAASKVVRLSEGEEDTWDARLERHHGVRIRLVNPAGQSIAGVTVALVSQNVSQDSAKPFTSILETDAEGLAHFSLATNGAHYLMAGRGRGDVPRLDGDVYPSESANDVQTVVLPPPPGRGATLRGSLVQQDGTPVTAGRIRLDRSGEYVYRELDTVDGSFEIMDLFEGSYRVIALLPNFGAVRFPVTELAPGELVDLGTTRLEEPARVTLEWRLAVPSKSAPWQLAMDPKDTGARLVPIMVIESPVEELRLVPGSYLLYSSELGLEAKVEIESGQRAVELVVGD